MKHSELKKHIVQCPNRPTIPPEDARPDINNAQVSRQIEEDHQLALQLARNEETNAPVKLPRHLIYRDPPPQPQPQKRSHAMDNLLPRHMRIYQQRFVIQNE